MNRNIKKVLGIPKDVKNSKDLMKKFVGLNPKKNRKQILRNMFFGES